MNIASTSRAPVISEDDMQHLIEQSLLDPSEFDDAASPSDPDYVYAEYPLDTDIEDRSKEAMLTVQALQGATLYSVGGKTVGLAEIDQTRGMKGQKRNILNSEKGAAMDGVTVDMPPVVKEQSVTSPHFKKDWQDLCGAFKEVYEDMGYTALDVDCPTVLYNSFVFYREDEMCVKKDDIKAATTVELLTYKDAIKLKHKLEGRLVNVTANGNTLIYASALNVTAYRDPDLSYLPKVKQVQQTMACWTGTDLTCLERINECMKVAVDTASARNAPKNVNLVMADRMWLRNFPVRALQRGAALVDNPYQKMLFWFSQFDKNTTVNAQLEETYGDGWTRSLITPRQNECSGLGAMMSNLKLCELEDPSIFSTATALTSNLMLKALSANEEVFQTFLHSSNFDVLLSCGVGKKFEAGYFYKSKKRDPGDEEGAFSASLRHTRAIFNPQAPTNVFFAFIYKMIMFGYTPWKQQVEVVKGTTPRLKSYTKSDFEFEFDEGTGPMVFGEHFKRSQSPPIILYNASMYHTPEVLNALKEIADVHGYAVAIYSDNVYIVVKRRDNYIWYSLDGEKMEATANPFTLQKVFEEILETTRAHVPIYGACNIQLEDDKPVVTLDGFKKRLAKMLRHFVFDAPVFFGTYVARMPLQKSGNMFTYLINCITAMQVDYSLFDPDHEEEFLHYAREECGVALTIEKRVDLSTLQVPYLECDFLGADLTYRTLLPPFSNEGFPGFFSFLQTERQAKALFFNPAPENRNKDVYANQRTLVAHLGVAVSMLHAGACLDEAARVNLCTLIDEYRRRIQREVADYGTFLSYMLALAEDPDNQSNYINGFALTPDLDLSYAVMDALRGITPSVTKYLDILGYQATDHREIFDQWALDAVDFIESASTDVDMEERFKLAQMWVDVRLLAAHGLRLAKQKMAELDGVKFEGRGFVENASLMEMRVPEGFKYKAELLKPEDYSPLPQRVTPAENRRLTSERVATIDIINRKLDKVMPQLKPYKLSLGVVEISSADKIEKKNLRTVNLIYMDVTRVPMQIMSLPKAKRSLALQYYYYSKLLRALAPDTSVAFVKQALVLSANESQDQNVMSLAKAITAPFAFLPRGEPLQGEVDYKELLVNNRIVNQFYSDVQREIDTGRSAHNARSHGRQIAYVKHTRRSALDTAQIFVELMRKLTPLQKQYLLFDPEDEVESEEEEESIRTTHKMREQHKAQRQLEKNKTMSKRGKVASVSDKAEKAAARRKMVKERQRKKLEEEGREVEQVDPKILRFRRSFFAETSNGDTYLSYDPKTSTLRMYGVTFAPASDPFSIGNAVPAYGISQLLAAVIAASQQPTE
jgi:hypothetical protein